MTEVNQDLEDKLWSILSEKPLDSKTCNKIIDYLLARLSDYLKINLEIVGENWIVGSDSSDEFSCNFSTDFREIGFSHRVYDIKFGGILAVQLVDDEYGVTASSNLYLFGSRERLFAGQKDRNYIGLDYLKNDNNFGEWFSHGWLVNEFDEFEDIDEETYGLSSISETSNLTEQLQIQEKPKVPSVKGLVIATLVKLGFAEYNMKELNKLALRNGFYRNPFTERYVIKDIDKAAENLGEDFIFTFYTDQDDFTDQANCIVFTVKGGKFINPEGWKLVYNKEKGYTEAVLLA